jgi:hypothetical protein
MSPRDVAGGVEAAPLGVVILSGGLEVNLLVRPAHRPVDAPGELGVPRLTQVDRVLLLRLLAEVREAPLAIPPGYPGRIAVSESAEDAHRPPLRGKRGCAKTVEDLPDLIASRKGRPDTVGIGGCAVAGRLVDVLRGDTYPLKLPFQLHLVGPGVALMLSRRIRHEGDRPAQILGKALLIGNVGGNLSEHIVVIPGVQKANLPAFVP